MKLLIVVKMALLRAKGINMKKKKYPLLGTQVTMTRKKKKKMPIITPYLI